MLLQSNMLETCPDPAPSWGGACSPCTANKKYNYRSGLISTNKSCSTQFGYIEARVKLPFKKGWGFFPAFWTVVFWNLSPHTNAAEIDIFEMFGGIYSYPNKVNTCIHTCYGSGCNESHGISHHLTNFNYTDWNTYAIEWNADRLIWYVNGNPIRALTSHKIVDPVRIILNLAVQSEKYLLPPTSPPFQEYMYVDYVKVYQLKCDKNTVVTNIPNFDTYYYAVKKSISLDGTTTIPAGRNITLRADKFIELLSGFEVQKGRELYLDVSPCVFSPDDCVDFLTYQTITTNTTINGCDVLYVQDVDILNSAKVDISAGEKITIKPGFRAVAGTDVKIKIEP